MKIKLDENLPESLAELLVLLGHDADTVRSEGLAGAMDPDVWAAAQSEGRFLITQDLDFSDMRLFAPGTHHGILLVRLRDAGRAALIQRVNALFCTENVEDWHKCFVVMSDHKLRVIRPSELEE
jgi:predicted nuclease of predicted toxin-antitoxin system